MILRCKYKEIFSVYNYFANIFVHIKNKVGYIFFLCIFAYSIMKNVLNRKYSFAELFSNGSKILNYPINPTKNEIRNIIRGTGEVTNGAAIQAAASYIRGSQGASEMAERRFDKKEELKKLTEYINTNK